MNNFPLFGYSSIKKRFNRSIDLLQKQVAITLGITKLQYGLYKNRERSLPIDKLYKLAKSYNSSDDYLLGLTD